MNCTKPRSLQYALPLQLTCTLLTTFQWKHKERRPACSTEVTPGCVMHNSTCPQEPVAPSLHTQTIKATPRHGQLTFCIATAHQWNWDAQHNVWTTVTGCIQPSNQRWDEGFDVRLMKEARTTWYINDVRPMEVAGGTWCRQEVGEEARSHMDLTSPTPGDTNCHTLLQCAQACMYQHQHAQFTCY